MNQPQERGAETEPGRSRQSNDVAELFLAKTPQAFASGGGAVDGLGPDSPVSLRQFASPLSALRKTPLTSQMVSPLIGWRRLCAKTGGSVSLVTFYRWIRNGKVYSIRMGQKIFIPVTSLDGLINHCMTGEDL